MKLKGNRCAICEVAVGDIPDEDFHFHHPDPSTKRLTVSDHRGKKRDIIDEVIHRTELLCSGCHTKVHSGEVFKEELKKIRDECMVIAKKALERIGKIDKLLRSA